MLITGVYKQVFTGPIFIVLAFIFIVDTVFCCFRQGFAVNKIGFYLSHLGIAAIFIGAILGYGFGTKATFNIDVDKNKSYSKVKSVNKNNIDFGFSIGVEDFKVDRYDPEFSLYINKNGSQKSSNMDDYQFIKLIKKNLNGSYSLGEYGVIDISELRDKNSADGFKNELLFDNGAALFKENSKDKHYLAKMIIKDSNGVNIKKDLEVNKPVKYKGWKFYLMSYDKENSKYIVVEAKYDPGVKYVILGLWMTMIGTIMMCFKRRELKGVIIDE